MYRALVLLNCIGYMSGCANSPLRDSPLRDVSHLPEYAPIVRTQDSIAAKRAFLYHHVTKGYFVDATHIYSGEIRKVGELPPGLNVTINKILKEEVKYKTVTTWAVFAQVSFPYGDQQKTMIATIGFSMLQKNAGVPSSGIE